MVASPSARAEPTAPRHLVGQADRDGTRIAVAVGPASRVSLSVSFPGGEEPADQTVFRRLLLEVPGRGTVELSACRFAAERVAEGWSGRLVFLEDAYDLAPLFDGGAVVNLRAFFSNVPLVLAQREGVRRELRDLLADVVYDLSVHRRFFDEQDRILAGEPPHVAQAARDAILASEGPRFFGFLDDHLASLEALTRGFTREEHERHGSYLRRMVWPHVAGAPFLRRSHLKPRGYAGDAGMLEMIYEDRYEGASLFDRLMHRHPLEQPAAQAVRNRRRLLPRVLREVLGRFPRTGRRGFRVLSVGCGPARELEDLYRTEDDLERIRCALLDPDAEALELARGGLQRVEAARGVRIDADLVEASVRTMLRARDLAGRFGRQHLVYSMSLLDDLTTPVARAVLARLWELVLPGGTLLVGNFHAACASRTCLDYWWDWPLVYRTEAALLELAAALPGATGSVTFDESRSQMFLRVERAG